MQNFTKIRPLVVMLF